MQSFLLLFMLAWIGGIAAGVAQAPWWGVLVLAAAAATLPTITKHSAHVTTAAILITLLGFLAVPLPTPVVACTLSTPAAATIIEQAGSTEQSRRYVAVADGCLLTLTVAPFPRLQPGDRVTLSGKSPEPVSALEAEYPEYAQYLAQQGISATWYFPEVSVIQSNPSLWQPLRSRATTYVHRLFPEPTAGLAAAMLLNETTGLSEEIVTTFRATGLSHIIAISGSNVSLLTGLVLLVLLALPLSPRLRTFTLIGILWLYIGLIGAPVSAVRAAFFWTMALIAFRLHRLVSLPTVFLLTAVLMISFQPVLLRDVGFQLSMAAVAGIFLILFLRRRSLHARGGMLAFGLNAILVTLGATLATAPVSAYHFGTFAPIGLLSNLAVVPLMSLFLILAVMAAVTGLVFPLGGALIASGVHAIARSTILISNALGQVPGGYLENISLPWWAVLLYYGILAGLAQWWLRHQGRTWREVWQ